jgi:hypothetical protein
MDLFKRVMFVRARDSSRAVVVAAALVTAFVLFIDAPGGALESPSLADSTGRRWQHATGLLLRRLVAPSDAPYVAFREPTATASAARSASAAIIEINAGTPFDRAAVVRNLRRGWATTDGLFGDDADSTSEGLFASALALDVGARLDFRPPEAARRAFRSALSARLRAGEGFAWQANERPDAGATLFAQRALALAIQQESRSSTAYAELMRLRQQGVSATPCHVLGTGSGAERFFTAVTEVEAAKLSGANCDPTPAERSSLAAAVAPVVDQLRGSQVGPESLELVRDLDVFAREGFIQSPADLRVVRTSFLRKARAAVRASADIPLSEAFTASELIRSSGGTPQIGRRARELFDLLIAWDGRLADVQEDPSPLTTVLGIAVAEQTGVATAPMRVRAVDWSSSKINPATRAILAAGLLSGAERRSAIQAAVELPVGVDIDPNLIAAVAGTIVERGEPCSSVEFGWIDHISSIILAPPVQPEGIPLQAAPAIALLARARDVCNLNTGDPQRANIRDQLVGEVRRAMRRGVGVDPLMVWLRAEARCALGEGPPSNRETSEVERFVRPSGGADDRYGQFSVASTYAALRLAHMAKNGCSGGWWAFR